MLTSRIDYKPYVRAARKAIRESLLSGYMGVSAFSSGKDSSAVLNLVVTEIASIIAEHGEDAVNLLTILNGNTLIDNPEVERVLEQTLADLEDYCKTHGVRYQFHQSKPNLLSSWQVKILSGRNYPVFANKKNRDCSIDLKVNPLKILKKKVFSVLQETGEPLTFMGTRLAEGKSRKERMEARGESAEEVWGDDDKMLSPLADWSDEVLWGYLHAVNTGVEEGVSDFQHLIDLYTDGSVCQPVDLERGLLPECRTGCLTCCVGRDKSLEAMLENNPIKYGYLREVNRLQRYLLNTQYDWNRRQWISRTINKYGYIKVQPDTYSPEFLEELALIMLSIDAEEINRAAAKGMPPRFTLLGPQEIIAIDALWSSQGIHRPFHLLHLFKRVNHDGERYFAPEIEPVPRTPLPAPRYIHAGEGWVGNEYYAFSGMRDPILEMVCEPDSFTGCGKTKTLNNGAAIMEPNYDQQCQVNLDSALFILDYEIDYLLEKYHSNQGYANTYGFNWYIGYGVLSLAKNGHDRSIDEILKRTAYREDRGLIGANYDREKVLAESISEAEMKILAAEASGEILEEEYEKESQKKRVGPHQQQQLDLFEDFMAA